MCRENGSIAVELCRTVPILEVLDDYLLFQPSAEDALFVVSRVHHQERLAYC